MSLPPVSTQKAIIAAAARQYHIPPAILWGVYGTETSFGHNVSTSSAGAVGPFQFEPSTAQSMGVNPYDFRSAAFGAAKYLSQYWSRGVGGALSAYNAGPAGGYVSSYVNSVLSNAKSWGGAPAGISAGGSKSAGPQYGGSGPKIPGLSVPGGGPTKQFNAKAYQMAQSRFLLGNLQKQAGSLFNVPHSLQVSNPLISSGVLTPGKAPDPNNFMSTVYQKAQNQLTQLAGQPLKVHPGAVPGYKGYINPISGFTLGRTDMGVDANARPGTPIRALGDSQLVQVLPNWYAGQPLLLFKILSGPKAGQYWYVAEQISPATTHIGTVFHTGQPVGRYASSGTGIEIGWGSPTSNARTLADQQGNTGGPGHSNSPAGQNFRNFLGNL